MLLGGPVAAPIITVRDDSRDDAHAMLSDYDAALRNQGKVTPTCTHTLLLSPDPRGRPYSRPTKALLKPCRLAVVMDSLGGCTNDV